MRNVKSKYLDESSPMFEEISKSKTKKFLWDYVQTVLEGAVPGYSDAARSSESARKRMFGKKKSMFEEY